eukprot:176079-Amphidinium_carterae.1
MPEPTIPHRRCEAAALFGFGTHRRAGFTTEDATKVKPKPQEAARATSFVAHMRQRLSLHVICCNRRNVGRQRGSSVGKPLTSPNPYAAGVLNLGCAPALGLHVHRHLSDTCV